MYQVKKFEWDEYISYIFFLIKQVNIHFKNSSIIIIKYVYETLDKKLSTFFYSLRHSSKHSKYMQILLC